MPSRRKPDWLKDAEGNPGHQWKPNRPQAPDTAPSCPRWLPAEAKKEWRRVVPLLEQMNALSTLDAAALGDYCLCVTRLQECEADISTRGVLVPGDRGQVKNPSVQIARTYRASLQKWCQFFGFTPDARGRLNLPPSPEPDNLWEILNRPRHAA